MKFVSKLGYIALIISMMWIVSPANAQNPYDILKKAATTIEAAKGMDCTFALKANGETINGRLVSKGDKFRLSTPVSTTWFDGKQMWTLNASTKETTVTIPDASEILEVNPMAYLRNFSKDYFSAFSKKQVTGKHVVLLNPRKKGGQVKAIEIQIDKNSYLPSSFIVRSSDNSRAYLTVTGLKLNSPVAESQFTYPASQYKDYELIDLR